MTECRPREYLTNEADMRRGSGPKVALRSANIQPLFRPGDFMMALRPVAAVRSQAFASQGHLAPQGHLALQGHPALQGDLALMRLP